MLSTGVYIWQHPTRLFAALGVVCFDRILSHGMMMGLETGVEHIGNLLIIAKK